MSGDQIASFVYLMLLGCVLGGSYLISHRRNLGRGIRQAAIWALIFIGMIATYGIWEDLQTTIAPRQTVFAEEGRVTVPVSPDGHFHIDLEINGTPVSFIVDTGASDMVLSEADARAVGINVDALNFTGFAQTANGRVSTARVWLEEVSLGGISDQNVRALVNGGEMPGSLLGMTYLRRFEEVSFRGRELILQR